jgi:hypothetical protein
MCIIYYFRENPSSLIEKSLSSPAIYSQVGRGLIFWGETENGKSHFFRDGKEMNITLCDCRFVTNAGYAYRIAGKDNDGREWFFVLSDGFSYRKVIIKKNEVYAKKAHIMALFNGRSFKEVLGECCTKFVREEKIGKLSKEKSFAKKARKVLEEAFFLITKQKGNQQSRVKVCTTIKKLLASR